MIRIREMCRNHCWWTHPERLAAQHDYEYHRWITNLMVVSVTNTIKHIHYVFYHHTLHWQNIISLFKFYSFYCDWYLYFAVLNKAKMFKTNYNNLHSLRRGLTSLYFTVFTVIPKRELNLQFQRVSLEAKL